MSKESYARGFRKAAEAAGVDPTALAKYAQQYKTEGYAPRPVVDVGHRIPSFTVGDFAHPIENPYFITSEKNEQEIPDAARELRASIDPKWGEWIKAHTNAINRVYKPVSDAMSKAPKGSIDRLSMENRDIMKILENMYHDEMKRTTSAPPAKVTPPAYISTAEIDRVAAEAKRVAEEAKRGLTR